MTPVSHLPLRFIMRPAKRKFQGVPVMIPEIFDGSKLVPSSTRSDARSNLIQSMHFILASIVLEGQQKRHSSGFVPLNAKILNTICGKRYHEALKLLIDNKVIDVITDYKKGEFSRRYSLMGSYASCGEKQVLLLGSIGINYNKHFNQLIEANKAALEQIPFLTKWINPDRLTVEAEKAHSYIELYRYEMVKLSENKNLDPFEKELVLNSINRRTNYHISCIKKIKSTANLHRTGKDNRLYTPVTSLLKELRYLLKYDGEPLIGIDLKSSQPYLLTFLLQKNFFEKKKNIINLQLINPSLIQSYPLLYSIMVGVLNLSTDFQGVSPAGFRDINWGDDFYLRLCKLEEEHFEPNERIFKSRLNAKKQMMFILFNKHNRSKGAKVFATLFPKEWQIIKAFHSLEGHQLPILLQRLESHLILDHVCKVVSEKYPNAPLVTVHDSIYTTKKYADKVYKIMFNELKSVSGLAPGLNLEEKSEEEIFSQLRLTAAADFKKMLRDIKKQIRYDVNKSQVSVGLKRPLIYRFPEYGEMKLLGFRYLDDEDPYAGPILTQLN